MSSYYSDCAKHRDLGILCMIFSEIISSLNFVLPSINPLYFLKPIVINSVDITLSDHRRGLGRRGKNFNYELNGAATEAGRDSIKF